MAIQTLFLTNTTFNNNLCNIGKDIWAERDPVKYEQYTIYESNNDQKVARKMKEKKNP